MNPVGVKFHERVYCLDQVQAQFVTGQMQRRLVSPEPIAKLADTIWDRSMRNPDSKVSEDIRVTEEQKCAVLVALSRVNPEETADAWNSLREGLRQELGDGA